MSNCHMTRLVHARKSYMCACHRSYSRRDPRARNQFRPCSILKGGSCVVESGIHDGDPYRNRLCIFHEAVVRAIWQNERNKGSAWSFEGVDFGWAWDEYIEVYSSEDWRKWLGLIRAEYRKLKAGKAGG